MTSRIVQLGFEIGSDPGHCSPVMIPIRHMAVTGQTQESGKTTALEALIGRSGLAAIAFLTKRGEQSFAGATRVAAYFQERADWQFVESILESTMKQRMKFERAWIVKACKGAHTLADVQHNVATLMEKSKRSMDKDLFMLLGEYLAKVVPLIRALPKARYVGLAEGMLTVMDMVDYPDELQMLVISSTLEWIHKYASHTIIVIPEAWKFIPQGRNTPVKIVAEKLAREGAALRNYLWIDSQDMAAVDKMVLRACAVWLIGVQREANEIKRALSNMPAGMKKPKAEGVATLELGQFFACYGNEIRKTYVQPAWMDEKAASQIAAGRLPVHDVTPPNITTAKQPEQSGTRPGEFPAGSPATAPGSPGQAQSFVKVEEEAMQISDQTLAALRLAIKDGATDTALRLLDGIAGNGSQASSAPESRPKSFTPQESFDNEQLYQAFKSRLMQEAPALIKVMASGPEINVQVQRRTITMDDSTIKGKVAILLHEGWLDEEKSGTDVYKELLRRGMNAKTPSIRVYEVLKEFAAMGFLFTTADKKYHSVQGAKVNIVGAA